MYELSHKCVDFLRKRVRISTIEDLTVLYQIGLINFVNCLLA